MMAVDSKHGSNNTNGVTNGQPRRRKRPSSLLAVATSLPSVETSLDEFIARANQTQIDAENWQKVEIEARQAKQEEDDKRREADALRWKAAEQQLREGEMREQTLRRQLDGLHGKLPQAEARAAVAVGNNQDGLTSDLRSRASRAEERASSAELRAGQLAQDLVAAKAASAGAPAPVFAPSADVSELEERLRIAEAKAAKAVAAAK